jgi:hypothetical protein
MVGELKEYEAIFRQKMPGQVKENEYVIKVKADNPIDAQIKATEEWKKIVEPRDVRVKEIAAVMTAS